MNEINMNISSFNIVTIPADFLYLSSDFIDQNIHSIDNRTLPLLQFLNPWIFPIFILSIFGILLTIIISFLLVYFSIHRLNNDLILINLLICFSVCFIYIIVIFFLIRGNELFCGLREFLSQFAYALLYSALLCRYIMQWLSTRILSKRTKHLTSLLIYFLLIFTQIPIGILWWYFTIPRVCPQRAIYEYPKLKFHFQKHHVTTKPCSYQCIVDYRFYATYTYAILELILCTLIATYLFLHTYCHRNKNEKDKFVRIDNNSALSIFFNMVGFILINIAWLIWTVVYHFTHPYFVFPSLVIGMFSIGTICLVFILLPQIYFYSKIPSNDMNLPKTLLYSNKLISIEGAKDPNSMADEKHAGQNHQILLSDGSETSYELVTSGTYLPITRTPKGPFKIIDTDKTVSTENFDKFLFGDRSNLSEILNNQSKSSHNDAREIKIPVRPPNNKNHDKQQQQQQHDSSITENQSVSNNRTFDFVNPIIEEEYLSQSNSNHLESGSLFPSTNTSPYHDETIIPILCNSKRSQTSTPVKVRLQVRSGSSSVPTARRFYPNMDHRYLRHPYHHMNSSTTTPPIMPLYYSPQPHQEDLDIVPYHTMSSFSDDNSKQSILSTSYRYPYPYRQFRKDHRSLSQRLWDMDSDEDDVVDNEMQDNTLDTPDHTTPLSEILKEFNLDADIDEHDDHSILHISDDNDKQNLYVNNIMYK